MDSMTQATSVLVGQRCGSLKRKNAGPERVGVLKSPWYLCYEYTFTYPVHPVYVRYDDGGDDVFEPCSSSCLW